MRQKSPFGHLSDIFDGFKALGSLQCLSIIKHLPPRQQEIWRCARENLLVPSGLYRDKGRFFTATIGLFFCQASHAKPFHEMPDVLSSSRVCSSKWWFGEEAPGIFGPTCWRNRQTLAWSMVKSHNFKTLPRTALDAIFISIRWWHKRDISSKAARTWQFCGKQTIFSMFWVYHRWGEKEGNSQPISHTIKKCERVWWKGHKLHYTLQKARAVRSSRLYRQLRFS